MGNQSASFESRDSNVELTAQVSQKIEKCVTSIVITVRNDFVVHRGMRYLSRGGWQIDDVVTSHQQVEEIVDPNPIAVVIQISCRYFNLESYDEDEIVR